MKSLLENHADGTGTISLVRPEARPDLSKRWQNSSQAVSKRPHFLSKRPQSPKKMPTEPMETSIEGEPVFPLYNIKGLASPAPPKSSRILRRRPKRRDFGSSGYSATSCKP